MLVDPGTFTYRADNSVARYFRGTSAHNTLRVDGAGPVRTRRLLPVAAARRPRTARPGCARTMKTASRAGMTATRAWPIRCCTGAASCWTSSGAASCIEDRLEMAGTHRVELFFHCSRALPPRCSRSDVWHLLQVGEPAPAAARCRTIGGCHDAHRPRRDRAAAGLDIAQLRRARAARPRWPGAPRSAAPRCLRTVIEC